VELIVVLDKSDPTIVSFSFWSLSCHFSNPSRQSFFIDREGKTRSVTAAQFPRADVGRRLPTVPYLLFSSPKAMTTGGAPHTVEFLLVPSAALCGSILFSQFLTSSTTEDDQPREVSK